ncbi:glycoside hydrolase family 35 protein [Kribbella speibonae]|uniref:Beta-galactosidase n=1 Tax=Kribbella speibonae TaxID=1572660 RepID=A0A4R0IE84_9ACTN|nr:beta-galactosidase family protein [Kribbella speibonae]TCC22883.1 beta-galactosidase [Kribbella speibonae]TCC30250.1 beta-galactosidase [Kribbella speibonae]
MPDFAIGESDFVLDGRPLQIISGALHYFRMHPDCWADRIEKARLMGLNTIETYVPWNLHSPRPGVFDTSGMLDLGRFLREVQAAGLYAIVRPGPYICAELDNGGLPAWLFRDDSAGVRRYEPAFMSAVTQYLRDVLEIVRPLQIDQGGPVLLVQVENEYGAFGDDQTYLKAIAEVIRSAGTTVPLVTVDQPTDAMLAAGGLDGVLRTASFGSRVTTRLETLRKHQPTGPLMCMEFWDGWFDYWGGRHHTTSASDAAAELDALLAAGASVNIYMFHGGTNFGLSSGANDKGVYRPTITSYDYDAPLDEAGNPTEKFHAFREVISRYAPVPDTVPASKPAAPEFTVALSDPVGLLQGSGGTWSEHQEPPTLDDLDVRLAIFRTELRHGGPAMLTFGEVRDRVQVFLDGAPVGVLERERHERAIMLPHTRGRLELVVEDQGRVNYGPRIGEPKGLIGPIRVGTEELTGWTACGIDLDRVPQLWHCAGSTPSALGIGPTAWRATFETDGESDLFLRTDAWGKGIAWINGFCLGRYWRRGPQETLYVPAPLLEQGTNNLVVLELDLLESPTATFTGSARLGFTDL